MQQLAPHHLHALPHHHLTLVTVCQSIIIVVTVILVICFRLAHPIQPSLGVWVFGCC